MDHIPRPKNSQASLEFPYYYPAAWDHDINDFSFWFNYGRRAQWKVPRFTRTSVELDTFLAGRPFNDVATVLQSWLYFGMLAICLGQSDLSGFVDVNSAGEKILNTTPLLPLTQQWYEQTFQRHMQSPNPFDSYTHEFTKLRGALTLAEGHTDILLARFGNQDAGPQGRALFRIGVSIKLVWSTLREAIYHLRRSLRDATYIGPMTDSLNSFGAVACGADDELLNNMVHRGWCPNTIRNMHGILGLEGILMASMIEKDTNACKSHAQCSPGVCLANQVQVGTYVPRHAYEYHDRGACGGVGLPLGTAEKIILETGSFPIVRLWLGTDRKGSRHRTMEAVPFHKGLKYVAISHVWSDGLGDEKGNQILACQYDRLGILLSELMSTETNKGRDTKPADEWSPFFWLDTICVPHDRAARRLACARMASSYECADTVLVLDAELQAWSYTSGTDEEALLRIVTSGWTTRVWTLSEGILAKKLVFKLADTMFDFASCGERLLFRKMNGLGRFVTLPTSLYENYLKKMRNISKLDTAEKLLKAIAYTRPRSTSHPGDEIISLAVLMGMNCIEDIYDQPTWEGKMMSFLKLLPELPLSLLFTSGPKLSETGFRWAPAALDMDLSMSQTMRGSEEIAHLDRKNGGLVFSHQGMLLHGDWTSIVLETSYLHDCNTTTNSPYNPFTALYRQLPIDYDLDYSIKIFPGEEYWCFMESADEWDVPFGPYSFEENYRKNNEARATTALAVIIDAPDFAADYLDIELVKFDGVLVSNVTLEESGIISCRYHSLVRLTKYWRTPGPISSDPRKIEVLQTPPGASIEWFDITGADQAMLGTYRLTKSNQVWRVM